MSGIYSLVSISNDPEDSSKYILAISYDRNVLEGFIPAVKEFDKDQHRSNITYEIEENTRVVEITKTVILKPTPGSITLPNGIVLLIPGKPSASGIESARTKLSLKLKRDFSKLTLPLYCIQLLLGDAVVDTILDLGDHEVDKVAEQFEDSISTNPIMFDTLFLEGAMNA